MRIWEGIVAAFEGIWACVKWLAKGRPCQCDGCAEGDICESQVW